MFFGSGVRVKTYLSPDARREELAMRVELLVLGVGPLEIVPLAIVELDAMKF